MAHEEKLINLTARLCVLKLLLRGGLDVGSLKNLTAIALKTAVLLKYSLAYCNIQHWTQSVWQSHSWEGLASKPAAEIRFICVSSQSDSVDRRRTKVLECSVLPLSPTEKGVLRTHQASIATYLLSPGQLGSLCPWRSLRNKSRTGWIKFNLHQYN